MRTNLKNAAALLHLARDLPRLFDRVGHRFLEINVLAGFHGGKGDRAMPVIRRSHDHGVDIGTRQDFSIVERGELRFRALLRQLFSLLVDVANSHDLDIAASFGHSEDEPHEARSAAADADQRDVEMVVGSLGVGRCLCRRGGRGEPRHGAGSHGAAHKISAIDSGLIWHFLFLCPLNVPPDIEDVTGENESPADRSRGDLSL